MICNVMPQKACHHATPEPDTGIMTSHVTSVDTKHLILYITIDSMVYSVNYTIVYSVYFMKPCLVIHCFEAYLI